MLSRRSFLASTASAGALALMGLPGGAALAAGPYTADMGSLATHPRPLYRVTT